MKALGISSTTVQVAPGLLKALAILSDTTARRSAVDRELGGISVDIPFSVDDDDNRETAGSNASENEATPRI